MSTTSITVVCYRSKVLKTGQLSHQKSAKCRTKNYNLLIFKSKKPIFSSKFFDTKWQNKKRIADRILADKLEASGAVIPDSFDRYRRIRLQTPGGRSPRRPDRMPAGLRFRRLSSRFYQNGAGFSSRFYQK